MFSLAILRMGIRYGNLMLNTFSSDMVTKGSLDELLGTIRVQLHDEVTRFVFPMGCGGKVSLESSQYPPESQAQDGTFRNTGGP